MAVRDCEDPRIALVESLQCQALRYAALSSIGLTITVVLG